MRDIAEIIEHWHAGRPIQAVADSLGVDRKTVRKYVGIAKSAGFQAGDGSTPPGGWAAWLDSKGANVGGRRKRSGPASDELERFRERIMQSLRDVKPTTAWRRLHREHDLQASLTSFRRYIKDLLPEAGNYPRITVRRPDARAGEEAQVDYGFLGMWLNPLTGRRQAINVFVLILAFSRHLFARAVLRMDQQAWIESHIAAFDYFGGVPRRIVPDNLKAGVLKPDRYDPAFNRAYDELAHHYGFLIDPARAAKPTDKPHVERTIPFIRSDFWQGRSFSSLADINGGLHTWCIEIAGQRIHGTTRSRPIEVYNTVELAAMQPLPAISFELAAWVDAKVALDCHVQALGSWYSIPYQHVGETISVCLTGHLAQFYLKRRLIKTHLRVPKGQRSTDWNDYPPEKAAFFQRTPDWCRQQAGDLGQAVSEVVETVLEVQALHHLRQAQGILRLAKKYDPERLNAACARALAFGDPGYRTIRTILERGLDRQTDPPPVQQRLAGAFLRGPSGLLASLLGQEVTP